MGAALSVPWRSMIVLVEEDTFNDILTVLVTYLV